MNAPVLSRRASPSSIETARQGDARIREQQARADANAVLFAEVEDLAPYLESLVRSLGEAAFRRNRIETQHQMTQIAHVVRALIPLVNQIKAAP